MQFQGLSFQTGDLPLHQEYHEPDHSPILTIWF